MLVLLLDAAVLIGLYVYFSGGDSLSWGKAIGTAFAISLISYAFLRFLGGSLGIFALLPCVLVAPLMLWLICDLEFKKAMIAGSVFTAYRIVLAFALISMLS